MISFRNGVLKINFEGEQKAKTLYEIAFAVNIIAIFLCNNIKVVGSVTSIMTFACAILIWTGRKRVRETIPYNFLWYGIFIVYNALSCLWSPYVYSSFLPALIKMLVIMLIIASISIYVDTPEDLDRLMTAFVAGMVINVLAEFMSVPIGNWFNGSMGSHVSGSNPNEIAFWAVCAEMIAFYKSYIKNKRLFYILVFVFAFFAILSSSRKATIAAVLGPVIMMVLTTYKKSYIIKLVLITGIAVTIGYLIMTNDRLYNAVGQRFESMRNYFLDDTVKSDNSLYVRNLYIDVAKDLFYQSPVFGKGICSFANILNNEYGLGAAYAHNNYWQILSEYGIVGFALYYSCYVYILIGMLKALIVNKSRIAIMFITLMGLLVGLEWGMVTFNTKFAQIIIAMAYTATYVGEADGRKYNYIKNNINSAEEVI